MFGFQFLARGKLRNNGVNNGLSIGVLPVFAVSARLAVFAVLTVAAVLPLATLGTILGASILLLRLTRT